MLSLPNIYAYNLGKTSHRPYIVTSVSHAKYDYSPKYFQAKSLNLSFYMHVLREKINMKVRKGVR